MNIQNKGYPSIEQLTDQYLGRPRGIETRENAAGLTFREVLQQSSAQKAETGELKFSKHALSRLSDRNITLDTEQLERLQAGAEKAGEKGIRDSLVMVDRLALIVNIPNRTDVTAMDSTATEENIFTNINGAVIA